MTDRFREEVLAEMERRHISQRQLAEMAHMSPQYLWDMLSGRRSNLPARWQDVLDALDLEVVVRRRGSGE